MKPIRLEIEGVNSYSKNQVIDFKELTSRGLFGIFGNTGSGKSTILDAITLSLYGNIARSSKDFINSNSKKALVDFEFELGMGQNRKYYKITRRFKKKESKDKVTSVSDSVRLMVKNPEGDYQVLADKVGDVNTSIKNILGLEEGDFLKSVVLPQGKFSEFLSLGGKDRRNMLERIFGLEEYGTSLNLKLARKKKDVEKEITTIEAIMSQHSNISEGVLKQLKEDLKLVVESKNANLKRFEKLKICLEELKKLESDIVQLGVLEKNMDALMERDSYIRSLENKVDTSMNVSLIMPDILEYRSIKKDIDTAREELEKNKNLIVRLEDDLKSESGKLEELNLALKNVSSKMGDVESIVTVDDDKLGKLSDDLSDRRLMVQKYIQDIKALGEMSDEKKAIDKKISDLLDLIDSDKKRLDLEEEKLRNFDDLNREARLRFMVGELKKEWTNSLHEDSCECPLCGSHIEDASSIFEGMDDENIGNSYQDILDKKKEECEKIRHSISKNQGQVESYESRKKSIAEAEAKIEKEIPDLDIASQQKEIEGLDAYIRDQRRIIQEKNKLYMGLIKDKSKLDDEISNSKLEFTRVTTDIGSKRDLCEMFSRSIVEKTAKLDGLLPYVNKRIEDLNLTDLIGDIDELDISDFKKEYADISKIKYMQAEIEDHTSKKNQLKLTMADIRSRIGQRELDKEDLRQKEGDYEQVSRDLEELKERETGLSIIIKDTEERLALVKSLDKELKGYTSKMNDIKDLERLLKGNRFVEYLSQIYLKNIVIDASQRLDWITSGRYAIEINSDYVFVIRDNFNGGMRRSSDTLSGGETFLASLALALALSSQIQLKGSAPLEFFFLDEGFGSLDSDLLDTVMTSLEKLHNDNLSVGIISHVEELKSRVPMKLLVSLDEKDASSKCRIDLS